MKDEEQQTGIIKTHYLAPDLHINVEVYAGVDFTRAAHQAIELANKLGITVWFDFNGKHCLARPDDKPKLLIAAYYIALEKKQDYVTTNDFRGDKI